MTQKVKCLNTCKSWVFSEKMDGFFKKLEIFFKSLKVVICSRMRIKWYYFSKCLFRPNYEVLWQKFRIISTLEKKFKKWWRRSVFSRRTTVKFFCKIRRLECSFVLFVSQNSLFTASCSVRCKFFTKSPIFPRKTETKSLPCHLILLFQYPVKSFGLFSKKNRSDILSL